MEGRGWVFPVVSAHPCGGRGSLLSRSLHYCLVQTLVSFHSHGVRNCPQALEC